VIDVPPSVISVAIVDRRRRFRLWLPIFLLWPLLLVLVALALALAVVADTLLLLRGRNYHLPRIMLGCLAVLTAARGTTIHVSQATSRVDVTIR
jgi:hypothetical protein